MLARQITTHDIGGDVGYPGRTGDVLVNMIRIAGGTFQMGSDAFYPEERPVRTVTIDGFWIDHGPVTNDEFARFVDATGYVTVAERVPRAEDFPGAPPENLVAGSMARSTRA